MWNTSRNEEALIVVQEHTRAHHDEIQKLRDRVAVLEARPSAQPSQDLARLEDRINGLELWKGKVHKLLVEESPATGREKLSRAGKAVQAIYGPK